MLISKKRIWQDRLQTARHFYPKFAPIDLCFGLIGLFMNPYRLCRKFLQKMGADNVYAYGETPIMTYQRIVEQCEVRLSDVWIELGAGRGKGCFWLNRMVGCKVIGIEWIPSFVRIAKVLKKLFGLREIEFRCEDFEKTDLREGTIIYLYGNHPKIQIPEGLRVITMSEPLEGARVLKAFWVRFPWGRTTAYLQTFINDRNDQTR